MFPYVSTTLNTAEIIYSCESNIIAHIKQTTMRWIMKMSKIYLGITLLAILACLVSLNVQAQMPMNNITAGKANVTIANALKEGTALHVLVANNGTAAANLTSWKLVTDNNSSFTFPVFTLDPKAIVTVHTHKGNNTATDLYGSNFMWNGTHEIKLLDMNGMQVYDYRIGAQMAKNSSM